MGHWEIRTRRPQLGAALVATLCLAGCGSGSAHRVAPQPKLPASVAAALAARSEEVAQALDATDSCSALSLAQQLQQETVAAINAGHVPAPFQEHLGSTVSDLLSRIQCVRTEQPTDHGNHKGQQDQQQQQQEGND
jgi:hypothetical protein